MSKVSIPVPDKFDYTVNLQFLARSPKELLHKVENDHVIKLVKAGDEKVLFRVRPGKKELIVEFLNGDPSASARSFVRNYVSQWFDLETNLDPFYKMASGDKLLGPLTKKFHGYRIIGQPDLFESVIWAVLGQQINLQFAYTLKQRFVEKFGERLFWNQESYYLFPEPALIAGLPDDALLALRFSRQKTKYTIGISEAFASGEISKEKLTGLSLPEAKEILMKIRGIGNWTANYALMKTFRYPDAFPLEDAGIHNAVRNLKKMQRKPTLEEVKKIFRKYKGWEAYATLYLWKSL